MGERIFFSKLRKVLASWLLCIKFENARLVIFQIGYGPSHLISVLAVSAWLSPHSQVSLGRSTALRQRPRVRACARRGVGCWERTVTPHSTSPSSCFPRFPVFWSLLPRIHPHNPRHGKLSSAQKKPNAPKWGFALGNERWALPWVLGLNPVLEQCVLQARCCEYLFLNELLPSTEFLGKKREETSHFAHSNELSSHSQQQGL